MLVDSILEYYNLDPRAYQSISDKWVGATVYMLDTAYPIFTALLTLVPWIFYLVLKKKHEKNHKQFLWTIVKFSIAGLAFGLFLPTLVIWITGALAVRAIYGG